MSFVDTMPAEQRVAEQAVLAEQEPMVEAVWAFQVPFVGSVSVHLNSITRGRRFFDHLRHWDDSFLELWAGSLRVEYSPDRTLRPSSGLYLVLAALAGWTEGHWWHLPL